MRCVRPGVATVLSALILTVTASDAQQPADGTGVISGVVVLSTDAGRPVRRATVSVLAPGDMNRSAITDDAGRFAIENLPPGRYVLTVSKPAHVSTAYGARAAGRPGTPIALAAGQRVTGLRVPLTPGAAIAGTVRDPQGEPMANATVSVVRAELARATSRTVSSAVISSTTDDSGMYRVYGLAAGAYLVAVAPQVANGAEMMARSRTETDAELKALAQRASTSGAAASQSAGAASPRLFSYAPVFHPSTAAAEDAIPVTVAAGDERLGVDIAVTLVPVSNVEGIVLGPAGQPMSAQVSLGRLSPTVPLASGGAVRPTGATSSTARSGEDGVFRFTGIAPGTYTVAARGTTPDALWANAPIDVRGSDVAGVVLQLRPGLSVSGRVVFDATRLRPPADFTQIRLAMSVQPLPGVVQTGRPPGLPRNAATDGTFQLTNLTPGPYALNLQVPGGLGPAGWWLRSIVVDGRDVLDGRFEVVDRDLSDVIVTLSDRRTEIAGTLVTPAGQPAPDFVIVVLPEDRALWRSERRVRQVRPGTDGRFDFQDLPPGAYLLAAVNDLPTDDWRLEDVLSAIAPAGVKVSLGEGEKKTQNLQIR
jgi:uncharacterized protein (DUF2141 family)